MYTWGWEGEEHSEGDKNLSHWGGKRQGILRVFQRIQAFKMAGCLVWRHYYNKIYIRHIFLFYLFESVQWCLTEISLPTITKMP